MLVLGLLVGLAAPVALTPSSANADDRGGLGSARMSGTVMEVADGAPGEVVISAAGRLLGAPAYLAAGLVSGDTVALTLGGVSTTASASRQVEQVADGEARITGIEVVTRASTSPDLSSQVNGTRTLVLAPTYAGSAPTIPLSTIEALGTNVATWAAQQTGGGLTLDVVVKPWKQVGSYGDCQSSLFNAALTAHGLTAPAPTGRTHVAVILPVSCSFWAGLATLGGREIWIGGDLDPVVLAHEFGHNLGLDHSNRLVCPAGVIRGSGDCGENEYGDVSDAMGSGDRTGYAERLNAAQANRLGLVQSVTASTTQPTTVTLEPIQATSGTRALRIPVTGGALFVEYRPDVRDLGSPAPEWSGVQVREMRVDSTAPLLLAAGATSSLTDVARIPLDPTAGTVLPGTGLAISVLSSGASAVVRTVPVSSDPGAPAAAILAGPANDATLPLGPVTFTWSPGSDGGSGLAGERLVITDTGPWAEPQRVLAVPPGATSMVVAGLRSATYTWRVVSEDRVGRTAQTATRSFRVDGDAPFPAYVETFWDPCLSAAQEVSWSAATDDAGGPSTYRLLVDGAPIRTTTALSTTVAAADLGAGSGPRTVTLESTDAAGNAATAETEWVVDAAPPGAPPGARLLPGPSSGTWWLSVAGPGSNDGYAPQIVYAVNGVDVGQVSDLVEVALEPADVVTVRSEDACGLASGTVALGPAQRSGPDATPPSAPVLTAPAYVMNGEFPLTWTAATDTQSGVVAYDVLVDGQVQTTVDGSVTSTTLYAYASESVVTVRARNGQNLATESAPRIVSLDATPPSEPVVTSPASDATVSSPYLVSWTPSTDAGSGLAGYRVTVGDATYTTGPGSTSLPVTSDGPVSILVEAFDALGNTACCGFTFVRSDGPTPGAPGAALTITGATSVVAGTRTFTLSGQSAAASGAGRAVRLWFQRTGSTVQLPLARVLLRPTGGGSFGATVPVSLVGSGTLHARMDEPAGFASASASLPLTVSQPPPPLPPPATSSLSGWGSGTRIAAGGTTLTYSVKVLPGTGRAVRLERRTCGTCAWSTYLTRTTSSSSIAAVPVPVQAGTRYWRVVAPATSSATSVASGTLTVVPATTISGWATTTVRAASGTSFTRTVTVTPVKQRKATLQYRTCSTCAWRTYRTVTTTTGYKATFRVPVVKGTRYWRVYAPLVNGGAARATPVRKVVGR